MTYTLSTVCPTSKKPQVVPACTAPVERHMSRLIIERGTYSEQAHPLSVIEVKRDDSDMITSYEIAPYSRELPFTIYHDDPLIVSACP